LLPYRSFLPPENLFRVGNFPTHFRPDNLLVRRRRIRHTAVMAELANFVHNGAAKITPRVLNGVFKKLPYLKMEFTQIQAPKYPHLVDQLEFLADVVEDFADGTEEDIPYVTIAHAVFALIYAHRQFDLIPDSIPEYGHADDSGVVRTVLIEHERVLGGYAIRNGVDWSKITLEA
jgi:uncharacterized membrane protein YkvA (DUF1232 family)